MIANACVPTHTHHALTNDGGGGDRHDDDEEKEKEEEEREKRRERAGEGKRKILPQDRRPTEYRLGPLFRYQGHPKLMRVCGNRT